MSDETARWSPPTSLLPFEGSESPPASEPAGSRRDRSNRKDRPKKKPNRALEVLWLVLGIGVIAGIVYGVAVLLGSTVLSPQAWAERYVTLIAEGEFGQANAEVDPGIDPAFAVLLQDGVLTPGSAGIADIETSLVSQSGPSATVKIGYTLAGVPQEAELSLWRRLSFFGLASEWKVSTPLLGTLRLTTTGPDQLLVGGAEVSVPGVASFPAYPGVYSVTLADEKFFTLAEPLTAAVPSNDTVELAVAGLATDALDEAVVAAVKNLIDECAKSDEIAPIGCPFAGVLYDEYQKLKWKITDYPKIEVSDDGSAFISTKDGRAFARYERENFAGRGWVEESYADKFEVEGTVTITDGQVVAAFDDGAGGAVFG